MKSCARIKRLSHICLSSPDLNATVAFYAEVLGCTVAHEFKNDEGFMYGVFLRSGDGTFLEFFHADAPPEPGSLFRHFCLEVDDIEAMATHLHGKGMATEVRRSRSDRTLQCWISDPHGVRIEFHQHDAQSALDRE